MLILRRVWLPALLTLLMLAVPAPPRAEADDWLEGWDNDALYGYVRKMSEELTDERLAEISGSDGSFIRLVAALDDFGAPMSRTHPKAFGALLERLEKHATVLAKREGHEPLFPAALAMVTAARCRHRLINGYKRPQPAWLEAANVLAREGAAQVITQDLLLHAATWLGDEALSRGEDHVALLTRAREIIDQAIAKGVRKERGQLALAKWYVARARVGRAKKAKAYGKAAVLEGLAYLAPLADAETPPGPFASARVRLLAENHAGHFGVKVAVPVKTVHLRKQGLFIDVPMCGAWQVIAGTGTTPPRVEERMLGAVMRAAYDLRIFLVGRSVYVDRDRTRAVPTRDPKVFATAMMNGLDQFAHIEEVTKRTKPRKAHLSKDFSEAWVIHVEGYSEEGRWMRVSGYYFKGKKTKRTYAMRVWHYQKETDPDPVADLFLKSIRVKK